MERPVHTFGAVVILSLSILPGFLSVHGEPGTAAAQSVDPRQASSETELARLRAEVIRTLRVSTEKLEEMLAIHEGNVRSLSEGLEERRSLYQKGYISRMELDQTERELAHTLADTENVRRGIQENNVAITEALMQEEILKLPPAPSLRYRETLTLIRFDGSVHWSLGDAAGIEDFFSERFGRALPISAFGQSAVHDRMKFDHREAMDVALHPDSPEGQALMGYLRQRGIPFIAFRGKLPGSATGAHIHIGKPSIRNAAQ